MESHYLFKNSNTGDIFERKQADSQTEGTEQDLEQTGKYAEKRNEFLKRNSELQESLWRGRDSESMSAVKSSYSALNSFMNEEIPQDEGRFEERKNAILNCYADLVKNCRAYISSHKNPHTSEGKHRKAMVNAILSNAVLEKTSVTTSIEKLKDNLEEGMIWGNLFGEMKENVEMCQGVYDEFENRFSGENQVPAGSRTLELAKVISGAYTMREADKNGELVSDMALVWAQDNVTEDMKKEFRQFRRFVTKILMNEYRTAFAHRSADSDYYTGPVNDEIKRQFTQLTIIGAENYGYFKALKELAPFFGEDPLSCGVDGEEVLSAIEETPEFFNRLKANMVQRDLRKISYYRRVNARSFLDGFVNGEKLDALLGENVKSRQSDVLPFDVKRPSPETAGTEELTGDFDAIKLALKMSEGREARADVVQNEEGKTTAEKWMSVKKRIERKHGEAVVNNNIMNSDKTKEISGLNTNRVFSKLSGSVGGNMTPAQIEALYDKLLSRSRIGDGPEKLTKEQAEALFDEGVDELAGIYLDFLRKMEVTYGRLVGQMHPEDICRQFGDEFYDHMGVIQDTEQLASYMKAHYDTNSVRVREFVMLSDYFNDIFNRSFVYFTTIDGNTPESTYLNIEGQDPVRGLLDIERYSSIKGPQMNGVQKRKYNETLKKRFKDHEKKRNAALKKELEEKKKQINVSDKVKRAKAEKQLEAQYNKKIQNWDLRLFSEFRGVQN